MANEVERRYVTQADLQITDSEALEKGQLPRIGGYAAVFNLDTEIFGFKERIAPGAFSRSIREKSDVRALVDHESSQIIGRTKNGSLKLSEDERGLRTEIEPPKTTLAADLVTNIRNGNLDGMSFGFFAREEEWSTEEGVNVRTLKDVELIDVSIVTFPAYPQTSVAVRKRLDEFKQQSESKTAQDALVAHQRQEESFGWYGAQIGLEMRAQEVQAVKANKKNWTRAEFGKWLRDHDFKSQLEADDPDSNFHAARQFPAPQCKDGSFRVLTDNMPAGIQLRTCDRK